MRTAGQKSLPQQILSGIIAGLTTFVITAIMGSIVVVSYANTAEQNALQECATSYTELVANNLINASTTPETIQANCSTIKSRAEAYLKKFGSDKPLALYITGSFTTACGYGSTGCVQQFYGANENIPPIMTISYIADYQYGLEHTVAHEYVHVLTSHKENEKLNLNPDMWVQVEEADGIKTTTWVEPIEGVADCGLSYFTGKPFTGGAYMKTCTPEQIAIATAIIENTY